MTSTISCASFPGGQLRRTTRTWLERSAGTRVFCKPETKYRIVLSKLMRLSCTSLGRRWAGTARMGAEAAPHGLLPVARHLPLRHWAAPQAPPGAVAARKFFTRRDLETHHQHHLCRPTTTLRSTAGLAQKSFPLPSSTPSLPSSLPCSCYCPASSRRFPQRSYSTMSSEIVHPTIQGKLVPFISSSSGCSVTKRLEAVHSGCPMFACASGHCVYLKFARGQPAGCFSPVEQSVP